MKILFAGESWMSFTTHVKGYDTFYSSVYEEGIKWIKNGLEKSGIEVDYLPNHLASNKFPTSLKELEEYDVVVLSDIGANTLLLSDDTFIRGKKTPNRLDLIEEYVKNGGGFLMIGGYLTFMGIEGKGFYKNTIIDDILPTRMLTHDDRVERPEGVKPLVLNDKHEIFKGLSIDFPEFLGYNQTISTTEGEVLATINGDPFIAVREYFKGRTAVFTSDCSPHWAPMEFLNWESYDGLWANIINWLKKN